MEEQLRGDLQDAKPGAKLLFSLIIVIVVGFVFQIFGILTVTLFSDVSLADLSDFENAEENNTLGAIKYMQIIGALGTFIFSAFLLSFFYTRSWTAFFGFKSKIHGREVFLLVMAMILILPFTNFIADLNSRLIIPFDRVESYLREINDQTESLMTSLLKGSSLGDLLINIFMIAIIPAIGEELVFRGLIQKHLQGMFKSHHLAIFIASVIFSLGHFQVYVFLPRLFLGMVLGYAFFYGKSIWYPMIAHLLNNFIGVIFYFMNNRGSLEETNGIDELGTTAMLPVAALISLSLVVLIMWYWDTLYRTNQSSPSHRT